MSIKSSTKLIGAIAIGLASFQASAADIAREVQNSGYGKGSFSEIGISLRTGAVPLVGFNDQSLDASGDPIYSLDLALEGRFEYKRAFIEFIENSFSNVALGFSAYSTQNSNHEVILTSSFGDIERDKVVGFETIEDRDADINAGFRSSYYFGSSIVQLELVSDVSGEDNGVTGTLQIGHQTQVRNWNLHGLLGVRYFSDNVVDHLFGISSAEATPALPAYQAGDGLMPSLQVGATLPLNEKWIFRASAEYQMLPSSVSDSPLAQGDSTYEVGIGVNYVIHGS